MRRSQRIAGAAVLGVVLVAVTASAQRIWVGGGRFWRTPPKWATKANFDGSFNYCRGFYTSNRREAGGSGGHRLSGFRQQLLGAPGRADAGPCQARCDRPA